MSFPAAGFPAAFFAFSLSLFSASFTHRFQGQAPCALSPGCFSAVFIYYKRSRLEWAVSAPGCGRFSSFRITIWIQKLFLNLGVA
jgi:hypothetical protein